MVRHLVTNLCMKPMFLFLLPIENSCKKVNIYGESRELLRLLQNHVVNQSYKYGFSHPISTGTQSKVYISEKKPKMKGILPFQPQVLKFLNFALCFSTLVFLMQLSFKTDHFSRATIFKKTNYSMSKKWGFTLQN